MKLITRLFAIVALSIAGMAGGAALFANWRILALVIISSLALLLGINYWRATWQDTYFDTHKGFLKIKLHPAVVLPILALFAGLVIAGILYSWAVK